MMRTIVAVLLATAAVAAQTENVEVEPITCWWRTTAPAVRVGETFTLILTCSVLETEAARVVPDESRLDPAVVQLTPFEVVGGTRAKDVEVPGRRFFQYAYQLRVIAENVFASLATLPALEIAYKVESRVPMGDSVAGRDQAYALPTQSIRVLSLVPDTATDIREAPVATFTDVDDVGFRGTALRVGAWVLIALGVLLLALALVRWARHRRAKTPRTRLLPDAVILQGVRRELASIRDQSRAGWTADLAGRALAALRVVAAFAHGRPVAQTVVAAGASRPGAAPLDGQLAIDGRFGSSAFVSASTTTQHANDELGDALARFAAARYGRHPEFDATLDDALEAGIRAADRLRESQGPMERLWRR